MKRLWKRQRDILDCLFLYGHATRTDLYEILWPKEAKLIKEHDLTLSWGKKEFNDIKVKLCNTLLALKRRNLIVDRSGYFFLTPIGRVHLQDLYQQEIKGKNKKRGKK